MSTRDISIDESSALREVLIKALPSTCRDDLTIVAVENAKAIRAAFDDLYTVRDESSDGLDELRSLVVTLKQILEDAPSLGLEVCDLLFGGGDLLKPGFIEFRAMPASRTSGLIVSLNVTDKLRELVAAAAAGDLKKLRIE